MEKTHPNTSMEFPNTCCQFAIEEMVRKSQMGANCTRAKKDLITRVEVSDEHCDMKSRSLQCSSLQCARLEICVQAMSNVSCGWNSGEESGKFLLSPGEFLYTYTHSFSLSLSHTHTHTCTQHPSSLRSYILLKIFITSAMQEGKENPYQLVVITLSPKAAITRL